MPRTTGPSDSEVDAGVGVEHVVDGAADAPGDSGPDSPATGGDSVAVIYTDRRAWLLACVRDKRQPWDDGTDEPEYFGLANTEHQFRKALCEVAFPNAKKRTGREIQQLMAEELEQLSR